MEGLKGNSDGTLIRRRRQENPQRGPVLYNKLSRRESICACGKNPLKNRKQLRLVFGYGISRVLQLNEERQ